MSASTLLRSSRLTSGIRQSDLARIAKTSQAEVSSIEGAKKVPTFETLERLLRHTGHRIIAVPGTGIDAADTADRISATLKPHSDDSALRAFLDYSDSLGRVSGIDRVVLGVAEPHRTGSPEWDAALAALVDFWFAKGKLPRPGWIAQPTRFLATPSSPQLTKYDLEPDVANVPREFLRRNVLLERQTLESV
jgi:transcriptional regulator with XRE-family HTH domain